MTALNHSIDSTLAAIDEALIASSIQPPRPYLGASAIGSPCARALWYNFRWTTDRTIPADGMRRINDGHRGERVLIDMLRSVPGVTLWTEDPESPNQQISFQSHAGHFRGNLDGIIEGLLQAPKTPHVWEAKVCNEAKVRKLQKLILEKGEKNALEQWDEVYFAQAQIYMHFMAMKRHYLTVATPGVRDIVSCRTEYQPAVAKKYCDLATQIITSERPPLKLSENPTYFQCKFCDHHPLCHGESIPAVSCRTCAHSTAHIDEAAPWTCDLHKKPITIHDQRMACGSHAFHPDMLANHATPAGADTATGAITYRAKAEPFGEFVNGVGGISSRAMYEKSGKQTAKIPVETEVLTTLAVESEIPVEQLQAGDLSEPEWSVLASATCRLSSVWEGDERRKQALRAVIETVDSAFMALASKVTMVSV